MLFKFVLLAVSAALLLENSSASYDDSSTCVFSKPGVPGCPRQGTSSVSDLIGYRLDGAETYCLIKHPFDIWFLANFDYVWTPGATSNIFINGYYLVIVKINGIFYAIPQVGCEKPTILTNNNGLVAGTRTLTYAQVYQAITQQNECRSYDIPCNVVLFRKLVGPYPAPRNVIPGGNVLLQSSGIQSAVILAQNETGYQIQGDAKKLAKEKRLDIVVKSGSKSTVIITENRSPSPPRCVTASYDLFLGVKDVTPITCLQPNSVPYLATLVAQQLTNPSTPNGRFTYSELFLFQRSVAETIFVPAYVSSEFYQDALDSFLST